MGFSLKYALAGAAKRGSEIIEETRKDANFSFMDQQQQVGTKMLKKRRISTKRKHFV